MRKMIVISLLGYISYADAESYNFKDRMILTDEQKYEMFTKQGLSLPGEPPRIMSKKELNQIMASLPKETIEQQKKINHSLATKGYAEEININAVKMLLDKEKMKADVQDNLNNTNPMHTHLRSTSENLKTGFEYKAFSNDIAQEVIGFSPQGSYIKDFGWSGASEFFVPKGLEKEALCIYNQTSIGMNGTTASYPEDQISYVVNNKFSSALVSGSTDTAFTYSIEWWDSEIFHELECFQRTYSKETMNKVIGIAQAIDKSISG